MDKGETKPLTATCLAAASAGTSHADTYTVQQRVMSYHKALYVVPREGMPQWTVWAATLETEERRDGLGDLS